jgi:hypothetical protein
VLKASEYATYKLLHTLVQAECRKAITLDSNIRKALHRLIPNVKALLPNKLFDAVKKDLQIPYLEIVAVLKRRC